MVSFARASGVSLLPPRFARLARGSRLIAVLIGNLLAALLGLAEDTPAAAGAEFGKDVQLAPFTVNGKSLSVAIHARTKGDRKYAEGFAEEVVQIAYETLEHSTGRGLVIVGAEGEPHPIHVLRQFLALAHAGKVEPGLAEAAGEVDELLKKVEARVKIQEAPDRPTGITFDLFIPALPVPLQGASARLYQLAWAQGFDDARIEQKLQRFTRADLARDEFSRYDWVFYLPPHSATAPVLKEMVKRVMAAEKMGVFKRAAIRSAMFVFAPLIKEGVEGLRKGMLFATILHAQGKFAEGDLDALTNAYLSALKPDLKPGDGDRHGRALAAIAKQKIANAEYAKDPFVTPARLATFDPAAYAAFVGEYSSKPPETSHWFKREGDVFQWNYKALKPRVFYPAGDRLLVNEDGTMTIHFLVDANGAVTGVEERWVRRRQIVPRNEPREATKNTKNAKAERSDK